MLVAVAEDPEPPEQRQGRVLLPIGPDPEILRCSDPAPFGVGSQAAWDQALKGREILRRMGFEQA